MRKWFCSTSICFLPHPRVVVPLELVRIQLKGSGPTPYSRGGDGRAPLGPVLREYIVGEAMAALGIPTTRSLAAVATGAEDEVLSRDALDHLRRLVRERDLRAADIAMAMPALEEARELSRGNVNPQLVIAGTVRKIRRALRPQRFAPTGAGP